jgi:hypothetical protein
VGLLCVGQMWGTYSWCRPSSVQGEQLHCARCATLLRAGTATGLFICYQIFYDSPGLSVWAFLMDLFPVDRLYGLFYGLTAHFASPLLQQRCCHLCIHLEAMRGAATDASTLRLSEAVSKFITCPLGHVR